MSGAQLGGGRFAQESFLHRSQRSACAAIQVEGRAGRRARNRDGLSAARPARPTEAPTLRGVTGRIIERYLQALTEHDWDAFAACLADEFTRVGPYGDAYPSKPEYVAFISELMPRLPDYAMEVRRITYADRIAFAELNETVTVDDVALNTPECLMFDLTEDGLISHIEVFIQTMPPRARKV
jgi:hypothetical protein